MTHTISPQLPLPDLSSCDKEPIHIPGSIQPHGVLLAIEEADLTIVHASANCEEWLHQASERLLGRSLDALLTSMSVVALRKSLAECSEAISSLRTLQFVLQTGEPISFLASAHRSSDLVIIELERLPAVETVEDQSLLTLMGRCRIANRRLGQCESMEELCEIVTEELGILTGYDRIMVYQFDEEWNGAVIAEHRLECLEPYLGLHYPATDIPVIARAMFLLNGLRVIPDALYQPVPLRPPVHARTAQPLDLSRAHLRSVSPIHLEYLRNMGVRASLTISLVVDGKLWGLIACHHRSSRFVSPAEREAFELFGQMASRRLTERIQAAGKKIAEQSKEVLHRLADRVQDSLHIIPTLLADPNDLLALTNATGAIIWRDGEALSVGVTPPVDSISALLNWVLCAASAPMFFTDCLPKRFQGAEGYAEVASGMVALALSRSPDVFILWFRPEVITTIDWAGDPAKSMEPLGDDGRIHPRKSFALWKESVRNRSLPWLTSEIEAVEQLRIILQDRLARTAEQLGRLIPICAWCKKVRSDQDYWQQVEAYVEKQLDIRFTHGVCPDCLAQEIQKFRQSKGA